MNMYVNEIQISNKQMFVCIISGPPPVISLLPTVLQSPIRLWFSMNNLTVTRRTFLVESCGSSVGLMRVCCRGSGRVRRRPSSPNQPWP